MKTIPALGQYQAEDPEGDAVAVVLSGPDSALFQIDEAGTLSLNAALDFEALGSAAGTNDYALTVVATDDGRGPVSQQLQVALSITNVNEEPVVIPVPVVELTVGNPATTLDLSEFFADPDGDSLTYALDDAESSNVASAVVEESSLSITPLEEGKASFVVTASDPSELSALGTVEVTVASPPPPESTPTPTPEPAPEPTPAPTPEPQSEPNFHTHTYSHACTQRLHLHPRLHLRPPRHQHLSQRLHHRPLLYPLPCLHQPQPPYPRRR